MRERRRTQSDRINAKAIFCTWAGLTATEASREDCHRVVQAYCDERGYVISDYIVCVETHDTPAEPTRNKHNHSMWILQPGVRASKFNIDNRRTTTIFDRVGDGDSSLHPEIISVGSDYQDFLNLVRYVEHDTHDGHAFAQVHV